MIGSLQYDTRDRMPGFFERRQLVIVRLVGLGFGSQFNEHAIVAVYGGHAERFAVDGDQAFAVLAGGLCNQLLRPRAEVGDRFR